MKISWALNVWKKKGQTMLWTLGREHVSGGHLHILLWTFLAWNHLLKLFLISAGSCILQFWSYSAASKPCKCPMCCQYINKLTPESSLQKRQQEPEVKEVLGNIQRYNRLFTGGVYGFVQVNIPVSLCILREMQMLENDSFVDFSFIFLIIFWNLIKWYFRTISVIFNAFMCNLL